MEPSKELSSDVVTIGGGIAGLYASKLLQDRGLRVAVLEARSRLGGRIYTRFENNIDTPIELGAEFVHGLPPVTQTFFDLDRELTRREGGALIFKDGALGVYSDFSTVIRTVMDRLDSTMGDDVSFADFLELNKNNFNNHAAQMARYYVEGYHAANPSYIRAKALSEIENEPPTPGTVDGAYLVNSGWGSVIEGLAAPLNGSTFKDHIVQKISWSQKHVRVECINSRGSKQIFDAGSALITVPAAVLSSENKTRSAISFEPALPVQKLSAISKIKSGSAIRISFAFKNSFWNKNAFPKNWTLLFDLDSRTDLSTWWTNGQLITGWIGGPSTQIFGSLSKSAQIESGLKSLSRIFSVSKVDLEKTLLGAYSYDWDTDPFSLGVYGYIATGGVTAPSILAAPVESTLFFAGEATQTGSSSGTVNGALMSAERVVQQIISAQ